MKSFIRTVSVCALLAWAFTALAYQANYQLINNPAYPSSDLGVATVNVLDQGLDNVTVPLNCRRFLMRWEGLILPTVPIGDRIVRISPEARYICLPENIFSKGS